MKQLLVVAIAVLLSVPGAACRADGGGESVDISLQTDPMPDTPGYHIINAIARFDGKDVPLAAGIFLPRAWFESRSPLPLVITLHNRGLNGSDGSSLAYEGLALLLAKDHDNDGRGGGQMPTHPLNLRNDAQFVGLAPQCPAGYAWETPVMAPLLDRLIDRICQQYHLDTNRVCLTGFSYGASSTWLMAMALPGRFSAIAPIAGRQTRDPPHDVLKLKDLAIYCAIGSEDHSIPGETQHMYKALQDAGHTPLMFKLIVGGSHWSYAAVYEDPAFWDWMLSQRRGPHPTTLPIVQTKYPIYPEPPPVVTGPAAPGHGILCQYWRDLPGKWLRDLTGDPSYPNFPSEQRVLPTMEIPRDQPGTFGTALRGWVCPPVTGDFTFYLASDNQGRLLLSPDDRPENLSPVAQVERWSWPDDWTQSAAQQSRPIRLLAGHRYCIEALAKCGGGDNHLSVAWKLPDGTLAGPIPDDALAPAPAVVVPGPAVVAIDPPTLPTEPGLHRLQLTVAYRGRQRRASALLLLPQNHQPDAPPPAIVYCPDLALRSTNDFHPATGPAAVLGGMGLSPWSPFVVIVPQAPGGANWQTPAMARMMAVVVDRLLHDLPIDRTRIYLTGAGAGGTDAWRLASRLRGRFAAIAPINAMDYGGNLPAALAGTKVHIITGVKNGVATDCANKMKAALAKLDPPPDVAYEMTMGDEVAGAYYGKRDFYQWLLGWSRRPGKPAVQTTQPTSP